MASLYDNTNEEAIHRSAIETLADEIHEPVSAVQPVYEREFALLKAEARIKDYLALFASRRTRATLLQNQPRSATRAPEGASLKFAQGQGAKRDSASSTSRA